MFAKCALYLSDYILEKFQNNFLMKTIFQMFFELIDMIIRSMNIHINDERTEI